MAKENRGGKRAKAAAEVKAADIKMPELEGSEKQVKWANDIRETSADIFDTLVKEATRFEKEGLTGKITGIPGTMPSSYAAKEARKMAIKMFSEQKSAEFYIEKRRYYTDNNTIVRLANEIDRRRIKEGEKA